MRPLVSVILTCFEHEEFVVEALEAVRAQTYRPIELVVTDDASTDTSAALIERWLDDHWDDARFVRHEVNVGLCRTLNEALREVTGEYVTISSADDFMAPQRLDRLVSLLDAAPPEVGLVYSGVCLVDQTGKPLDTYLAEPGSAPTGWIFTRELAGPTILTPSVMVRRSVFEQVGVFNEGDIVEDYDMWLRITRSFHVEHVPEALVSFRWHTGNTTTRIHGEPYDRYVADCLRRQLGHSEDADRIIHRRLAALEGADDPGSRPP